MKKIGDLGEQLVGRYLQIRGYELLKHNWRCSWGEIDLIVQDQASRELAFVEVKTRSKHNWDADGLMAINPHKQEKLIKTASLFLAKYPQLAELPCRFDVGLVSYQSCEAINKHQFDQRSQRKGLGCMCPSFYGGVICDLAQISQIEIGQVIILEHHQMTIRNYLPAAFD